MYDISITPCVYTCMCICSVLYMCNYCNVWMSSSLAVQTNRFRIYLASLCSDTIIDFNAPLPSGLIPSPSVNTLHNPDHASGESDFLEQFHRQGHTSHILGTPPASRAGNNFSQLQRHSPVLSRKPQFK